MKKYYYFLERKNIRIIILGIFLISVLNIEFLYNESSWNSSATTPYLRYVLTANSRGRGPAMIIIWYLAIYPLLLGIESTLQELNNKSHYLIISRVGRKKYILNTIYNNIKLPIVIIGSGLIINFAFLYIGYHGNELSSESIIAGYQSFGGKYLEFQYFHPYVMSLLVTIALFIVIGLISIQATISALLIEDRKIVYTTSFGLYYFFIASKCQITGILQPFDEYGFLRDFIPFISFIVIYGIIIALSYIILRKKYAKIY